MTRRAHLAALTLCTSLAIGVASARAEPPIRVHVDVHAPALVSPGLVEGAAVPHHHHVDAPPPPPEEPWDADRRHGGHRFHVPPDRVPAGGLCRIWYDDLPPDRQPPEMRCERAHRVARRHGGRVIWADSRHAHQDGRVASTPYAPVDFRGVPPDRLPPPGACRVWLDGVPPDRQPPPGPCDHARREARRTGGRVLYMPSP